MDPRIVSPGADRLNKAKLSPLMRAKLESQGEKVNACPFGCQMADLDDNGYCRHLIGFSNDGRTYEPMEPMVDPETGEPTGRRVVRGKNSLPVEKTDQLIQITTSSRVYRDVDKPAAKKAS